MDIYLDRNKTDKIINITLNSIIEYYKNLKQKDEYTINEWGELKEKDLYKRCISFSIHNSFKKSTRFRIQLMDMYEYNIIIEQGFLKRSKYYSLGINGIGGVSKYKPINSPSDRFDDIDIDIKDMKVNKEGHILVCGQLPWDSQVQYIEHKDTKYNRWLNELFNDIKKKTSRKIIFRYHPLYLNSVKSKRKGFIITIPNFVIIDDNEKLSDSLLDAYCSISYNSNSLLESIIDGIPIICFNKSSVVYNLSINDVANINDLYIPDKKQILQTLYDISYMQFTLDELRNGYAINSINSLIDREHLDGQCNFPNLEFDSIKYLRDKFDLKNIIDIGCGIGKMKDVCDTLSLKFKGLAEDSNCKKEYVDIIDFSIDKYESDELFDLGYSIELLDHIDDTHIENYMNVFKKCKYILITTAPEKWPSHNPVNCKNHEYWLKIFNKYDIILDPYETLKVREKSSMSLNKSKRRFVQHRGLFFRNLTYNKINLINGLPKNEIVENQFYKYNKYSEIHMVKHNVRHKCKKEGSSQLIKCMYKSTIPLISYLII